MFQTSVRWRIGVQEEARGVALSRTGRRVSFGFQKTVKSFSKKDKLFFITSPGLEVREPCKCDRASQDVFLRATRLGLGDTRASLPPFAHQGGLLWVAAKDGGAGGTCGRGAEELVPPRRYLPRAKRDRPTRDATARGRLEAGPTRRPGFVITSPGLEIHEPVRCSHDFRGTPRHADGWKPSLQLISTWRATHRETRGRTRGRSGHRSRDTSTDATDTHPSRNRA